LLIAYRAEDNFIEVTDGRRNTVSQLASDGVKHVDSSTPTHTTASSSSTEHLYTLLGLAVAEER